MATREQKIDFINKKLVYSGKKVTKKELRELSTEHLDAIIARHSEAFDKYLSQPKLVKYLWVSEDKYGDVYGSSEKEIREMLKSECIEAINIAPKKGHHICKYCNDIADGSSADILCNECREMFGHSLYSEL